MTTRTRRLQIEDGEAAARLLDREPIANVYLRSELRLGALRSGAWWATERREQLGSLMVTGALVVPYLGSMGDAGPLGAVVDRLRPPQLMSGPRIHVHALQAARRLPVRPREIRDPQPLLVLRPGALRIAADHHVRPSTSADLDRLTVASAAMHREEMGVDPLAVDPAGWRYRMGTLIDRGWSWVWMDGPRVVFKAELSAWTPDVCQIQGVYTAPDRRGTGVARAGMAAICAHLLRDVPAVSLYVNHFNTPALRLYSALGFEQVGELCTLFL